MATTATWRRAILSFLHTQTSKQESARTVASAHEVGKTDLMAHKCFYMIYSVVVCFHRPAGRWGAVAAVVSNSLPDQHVRCVPHCGDECLKQI